MKENILKRFNKLFKIEESLENEQNRFVQRINQTVFMEIEWHKTFNIIFRRICYNLGENPDDIISQTFRQLSNDNFIKTIKILLLLYQDFKNYKNLQDKISLQINQALSTTIMDIGIRWRNGMFYPSGAKILDEKLIEDVLDWLDEFQNEKKDFEKALSDYLKKSYGNVVIDCYLVVEGLTRKLLKNKKTLENNKDEILKKLKLSQNWRSIFVNYITYANEFRRHASDARHSINPTEVEAFLYFTGLLVRLIIQIEK